jgi:DNA-binding LytR/AlgR family response regulator
MKGKRFLNIILVCFISICGYSQNHSNIDTLISKASSFYKTNQDSALFYADLAYNKALMTDNVSIIANAAYHKSIYLIGKKEYGEAFEILQNILKNNYITSHETTGNIYYNIGAIYYLKEERDKAIENYLLAIEHYSKANYKRGLAKANLQIGVIYEKLDKMDVANYFYDISMASGSNSESSDHTLEKMPYNIPYSKKIALSKEMLQGINSIQNPNLAAIVNYNLAMSYYGNEDYLDAITSAKKSAALKEKIGFESNLDVNYAIIGKAYLNINDFKNAITYLSKAKIISSKRHLKNEVSDLLVTAYSKLGDFKTALETSTQLSKAKDSVNNLKESEEIARITAQFENEKQEKEILQLKQENQEKELLISKKEKNIWKWSLCALLATLATIFLGQKLIRSIKRLKTVEQEKEDIAKKVEEIAVVLNNKTKVYLDKLKYIKSDGNYLEFVTDDKTIIDRNQLKEILNHLPPNFVRVHRSYVINKNFINALNSKSLYLKPNIEIPLSRTYKANFI